MTTSLLAPQTTLDALAALFVVSTLVMMTQRGLVPAVRIFALQSAILALIAALVAYYTRAWELLIPAAFNFGLKSLALPRVFSYVVERIRVRRDAQPYVHPSVGLIIAGGLMLAAFWIVRPIELPENLLAKHALTASLSVVFMGFFMMCARRKAITQTLGLLVMENGMFLAALSLTYGMPLVVELGIAFDVLVAVIVAGILLFRINQTFDTLDASRLSSLHEAEGE